ncbi:MAG: translation initiation factor [Flavobacteriales bacterium]|nr:translation initiation factor [Flavobacteriales bacterium]MBX2960771.1 translation initiation factor [Flavobacteriales bacterium]MCL4856516.1 translation initiation factor [Flavobacteriales bacterium]
MSKKEKQRVNVVYSTNPNFSYDEEEHDDIETLDKQQQQLKVSIDRKQRKGKSVTIVSGFIGNDDDLTDLAKTLKTRCGVGGNAKDGEILIQGELKDKVFDLLISLGYSKTKKMGG